jgi:predicted ArsR family transcriptional regulator
MDPPERVGDGGGDGPRQGGDEHRLFFIISQVVIVIIVFQGFPGLISSAMSSSRRADPAQSRSTRDRILHRLRLQSMTVDELAKHVGLTPNAVRSQLAALVGSGLVRDAGVRHDGQPGQPARLFAATAEAEAGLSTAYAPALAAISRTVATQMPPARQVEFFTAAGAELAAQIAVPPSRDSGESAQRLLEQLGAAVSRRRNGGVAIVEGTSCPLADAVRECAATCELVRALLANRVGAPVATRCDHGESPRCRFEVG